MLTETKPSSADELKEFVIAGHFNLEKIRDMLARNPNLLNMAYYWAENDTETAIQAAAHAGNRTNAEFLLERGAPLEICTAAMLGRKDEVERMIRMNSEMAKATGAHHIPLLAHAAFSRNLDLIQFVFENGAVTGADLALHHAVRTGDTEVVQWLLVNTNPNINAKNFEGKTPLRVALERNSHLVANLLTDNGGTE